MIGLGRVLMVLPVQDAVEIEQLLNYLIDQENSEGFILIGHSTGCQVLSSGFMLVSVVISLVLRRMEITEVFLKFCIAVYMMSDLSCLRFGLF